MDNSQRSSKYLSSHIKNQNAQFFLQKSHAGVLPYGVQKEAVEHFGVSRKTTYRIWNDAKEQHAKGVPISLPAKMKGYNHKDKMKIDIDRVRNLSVLERSSLRKMATKFDVSKTTLVRWVKEKQIKPHTNAIKPTLTEANKLARLKWSLSQLQPNLEQEKVKFQPMHNVVHIDEKWFYMTKCSDRYYLLADGDESYRSCKSKRFITKVMFMCVVARPHFAQDGQTTFDGKIGIFPFTTLESAKRKSKNRDKGTLETKPIQSIKSIIRDCIVHKIIPAISDKWPHHASKEIFIQQDNVKPHISNHDKDFEATVNAQGFNMKIICQPPNSPDTNVLNLGFIREIQSLQDDKPEKGVDNLVRNVCSSYEELSPQTLNKVFLTLQTCLREILQVKGSNNYRIPHMNKDRLLRLDSLPLTIEIDEGLAKECLDYLQLPENDDGSAYDIVAIKSALGYYEVGNDNSVFVIGKCHSVFVNGKS